MDPKLRLEELKTRQIFPGPTDLAVALRDAIKIADDLHTQLVIRQTAIEEAVLLECQVRDAIGAINEFLAMPCDSLKAKLPTTVARLKMRAASFYEAWSNL